MKVGVCAVIIQDERVLLTKRADFEVWCLPGGHVDEGESIVEAVARETAEETGLEVKLTRLVGLYSIPKTEAWVNLMVLFAGKIVGGELKAQEDEVLEMDFFHLDDLPYNMLWGHRQRILDAFNEFERSVVRIQHVPFDPGIDRQELYKMLDESGMSGLEFYELNFGWEDSIDDKIELV